MELHKAIVKMTRNESWSWWQKLNVKVEQAFQGWKLIAEVVIQVEVVIFDEIRPHRILIGKESRHYTSALHSALAESYPSLLLEQAIQRRWARFLMRAWNMYRRWLVHRREGKSRSVSPSAWYEFTSSAAQFRIRGKYSWTNMVGRLWPGPGPKPALESAHDLLLPKEESWMVEEELSIRRVCTFPAESNEYGSICYVGTTIQRGINSL